MMRSHHASARQFFAQVDKLGVQLPKPVVEAHDLLEQIRIRAGRMSAGDFSLAGAVADALIRDEDPTTDPAVLQAIARQAITPTLVESAQDEVLRRLQSVCRKHADDIVLELRKPFDEAANSLAEAHKRIGNVKLSETATILRKGGDIASVFAAATTASKTIEGVISGWVGLGQFLHQNAVDKRWMNLRMVKANAPEWDDADLSRVKLDPWDALLGGFELSLPTLREFEQRRQQIEQQRDRIRVAASKAPDRPSYAV